MTDLGADLGGVEVVGEEGDDVGVGQTTEDADLVEGQVVIGGGGVEYLEGVVVAQLVLDQVDS